MKLEVVDRRVPFLIRVTTISAVKSHQVRVSFDGWPDDLSYWLDDDSPDIHPVGWCLKTGHPLEPPLTVEEAMVSGPCGVGGCRGLGSARGGAAKRHGAASACPYRAPLPPPHAPHPPDRLAAHPAHAPHTPHHALPAKRRVSTKPKPTQSSTPTSDITKEKLPRGRPPKHKRIEGIKMEMASEGEESVCSGRCSKRSRGVGGAGAGVVLAPLRRFTAQLALSHDPTVWSQHEVSSLVTLVAGAAAGAAAAGARLAGAELVMASCEELVACLRLRLGPAVKLYAAVTQLRRQLAANTRH